MLHLFRRQYLQKHSMIQIPIFQVIVKEILFINQRYHLQIRIMTLVMMNRIQVHIFQIIDHFIHLLRQQSINFLWI